MQTIKSISASTEEMNTQVEEINASAQMLEEMAHDLNKIIERFKLA